MRRYTVILMTSLLVVLWLALGLSFGDQQIPVDILKTKEISIISSKQGDGDNEFPDLQKALFMALSALEGTWARKADMQASRNRHSSSVVDGKIYVIGGIGGIWWNIASVEEYDPVNDIWMKKADIPTPRHGLSTSALTT